MGTWWTLTEAQRLARAEVLKKARLAKKRKREGITAGDMVSPTLDAKVFLVTERTNERTHTEERRGPFDRFKLKPRGNKVLPRSFLVTEPPQEARQPISFLIPNTKIQKKK